MFLLQILMLTASLVSVFWYVTFRRNRRRLYELADKLPGLPGLPLIGHLHRVLGDTEDIFNAIREISDASVQQGGITKAWLGHKLIFLLTDPVDVEYVLKTVLAKDDIFYPFIRKVLGNGTPFALLPIWRQRRKTLAPGFSTARLDAVFQTFREKSEPLSSELNDKAGAGMFDVWPYVSNYTLDSIIETLFGQSNPRSSEDYAAFLKHMVHLLRSITERMFKPWLQLDWLYRLTPSYAGWETGKDFTSSYINDVIDFTRTDMKREDSEKPQVDQASDMNTKWTSILRLLMTQSSKSQDYSNEELCEEVLTLVMAGTDTSAVGTCFTLLLLAKHQDIQEKIYQELVDVFGTSERQLVKEDMSKLCYLDRVIKESLRLYPPIPFISRQSDKEVTLPSGRVLPAGCAIATSIWGMHHNPKYWGADAEQFQPDRFSPEHYTPQHPCVYMPFSIGLRNCIGFQYALTSMKTSLSTVLRKYRVRAADDGPLRFKFEVMLKLVGGFNVILEKRET